MAGLKDRFEGIANDGAMTESEAVKTCITYIRELQSELSKTTRKSKLDRILDAFLQWNTTGATEGTVFSWILAVTVFCLATLVLVTIGNWGYKWYKETTEGKITPEYYMMGRDERDGNGNIKNECWYIDRLEEHASPCIKDKEEALSVLQRLEQMRLNGQAKPQTTQPND